MLKNIKNTLLIGLVTVMILSACSVTRDWKIFAVEEEPNIDIQFRLPPEWRVDYAPTPNTPGQWDILLAPPKCAEDQETLYSDNCIDLTVYIKGEANYDQQDSIAFASQSFALTESGSEQTVLMGQSAFKVHGLEVQRFDHKVFVGEDEIQLSFYFFETEKADYTFLTEFPYDEREEGEAAQNFSRLLESIEVID
jgi:hypothetical protein